MSTETENAGGTTETTSDASVTATADTNSTTATDAGEGQGQGEAGQTSETTEASTTGEGAPESYESFQLPEGYALEGERLDTTVALFKELNLSQAAGQKLIDAFVKADGENGSVLKELIDNQRQDQIVKWGEDSKAEYGKHYDAIVTDARAGVAWAQKERPNILATFDKEGWGNNPDALWVFAKLGELSRGSSMRGMSGDSAGGKDRPLESRMYPGMK